MKDILRISDISDPVFDVYSRHNETRLYRYYEPEAGLFIAESVRVIERALAAGYEPVSLLLDEHALNGEAAPLLERGMDIPVYVAGQKTLEQITGYPVTRGALCAMRRRALPTVEEVCVRAKRIVVLEHIMNPTNVGAIFRNAAALGVDAVLLMEGCSDPLYRRAIRVSMGNAFSLPWTVIPDCRSAAAHAALGEALAIDLHAWGFTLYALALSEDAVSLKELQIPGQQKTALFLGSENDGLSESLLNSCDAIVTIPMTRGVDSLNVAAASAVAFYAFSQ